MTLVRTTPQADEQAAHADGWWRENRQAAAAMFTDELVIALELLASTPEIGRRYRRAGIPGLRRLLMPGTSYHAYYVYDADADEVVVLAVWSAVRGRGPSLRP